MHARMYTINKAEYIASLHYIFIYKHLLDVSLI